MIVSCQTILLPYLQGFISVLKSQNNSKLIQPGFGMMVWPILEKELNFSQVYSIQFFSSLGNLFCSLKCTCKFSIALGEFCLETLCRIMHCLLLSFKFYTKLAVRSSKRVQFEYILVDHMTVVVWIPAISIPQFINIVYILPLSNHPFLHPSF